MNPMTFDRIAGVLRRYSWLVHVLLAFTASRLLVFAAAYVGDILLLTDPGHWTPAPHSLFLGFWAKWDSQWYYWIVHEGYWLNPSQRSNVAFFPLYPLLITLLKSFFGGDITQTGVVISHAAFLGALVSLYRLTELEFGDEAAAQRTIFYLALFPTSFFFSAMYTESLFLLLAVTSVYFARRRQWAVAAVMGFFASSTRVVGVLIWGVVMWEWLRAQGWMLEQVYRRTAWRSLWQGLQKNWPQVLVIAAIPLGLASYTAFLQLNFHDPLAFMTVQSAWGRHNVGPLAVISRDAAYLLHSTLGQGYLARLLNLSALGASGVLSLAVWRKLGFGYAAYTLLVVFIPAASSSMSIIRFVLAGFPMFLLGPGGAGHGSTGC